MINTEPSLRADAVFCQFIGWSRSGTTLLGALLNAHPEVFISQEADVSQMVAAGASRAEVLGAMRSSDAAFALQGRTWNGYDYQMPRHQSDWAAPQGSRKTVGTARPLQVVGDKKAAGTVEIEAIHPGTLAHTAVLMDLPLRLVCITRDPFDTVATLSRHLDTDTPVWFAADRDELTAAIDWYLLLGSLSQRVIDSQVAPVHVLSLEALTEDPAAELTALLRFLGVSEVPEGFLSDARRVVLPRPRRSSAKFYLDHDAKQRIRRAVEQLPLLHAYRESVAD